MIDKVWILSSCLDNYVPSIIQVPMSDKETTSLINKNDF